MYKLLIEAIVVGISTVIMGTVVSYLIGSLFKTDLPPVCKNWNKFYAMEISLFLTGALLHSFLELVGLNKWYCKNGNACLRR